ncbi:unnamed protein product [Cylicocyclus nassatus]|uniref:DUF5648 domain-containing protein n=1 Tax=Cylicocyclus nassatus TaxID=53992 RepID=A0AA36MEZ2_CYLNA|nr:unnamed protein product [Cylicocyclus nassatus]
MTKTTARCYNIFYRKLSKKGTVEVVERQLFVEGSAEDSDTAVRLIALEVNITAIELDSVVVETARKWFGVIEEENHRVIVQDGLEYLKEASKRERPDVIALDACDEAIRSPCPAKVFRDVEVIERLRNALTPTGLVLTLYVSLASFYSKKYQTHHYHTQPGPISRFLSDTYYGEGPLGRMITVDLYNQQKHELRRHCPFLVPLYTAINKKTKSQRMTTYVSELNVIMKSGQGWYKLEQVGYCVKGYKCGATKPLMEIRVKNKLSDVLYTSDMEEVGVVSKWKGWVLDTSPICYLLCTYGDRCLLEHW